MKTDAEWTAWLKQDGAYRVILFDVEVAISGVESVRRVSTAQYVTLPTDTPPNMPYAPIASAGTGFVERLSLTNAAGLQQGTIILSNHTGAIDTWLNDVWTNRRLVAYLGDPSWARDDFRPIFTGLVANIKANDATSIVIELRDKSEQLNTPVTETKLGGTTLNDDAIVPVGLGEMHNVSPPLLNDTTLTYKYGAGSNERVIEVRDNAVPVPVVPNLAQGEFSLTAPAEGVITLSFQGDNVGGYRNTVGSLIRRLATGFGKASTRFTDADVELNPANPGNFVSFEAANPQPVGLWLPTRTNVLNAIQMLANSVGAQMVMSRLGLMRLFKITLPVTVTTKDVLPSMYVAGSFKPAGITEVKATIKLGYCKNWTEQVGYPQSIPAAHRDLYALEWLTETRTVDTVKNLRKLDTEPDMTETMLLTSADAIAECDRLKDIWSVPHEMYEFEGKPELLELYLGQGIKVYYKRWGFKVGRNAMVIMLEPNYKNCHVKVGIIV